MVAILSVLQRRCAKLDKDEWMPGSQERLTLPPGCSILVARQLLRLPPQPVLTLWLMSTI